MYQVKFVLLMMQHILIANTWLGELLQVMKDMASGISINPKYDGYQRELASMDYKFFRRKEDWDN